MMEGGEIRRRRRHRGREGGGEKMKGRSEEQGKEKGGRGKRDGYQRGRREGGKIRFNRSQEH